MGANSRLGAYSNKYGNTQRSVHNQDYKKIWSDVLKADAPIMSIIVLRGLYLSPGHRRLDKSISNFMRSLICTMKREVNFLWRFRDTRLLKLSWLGPFFRPYKGVSVLLNGKKPRYIRLTKPNFLTCLTKGEWCKKNLSKKIIKWSNLKRLNPSDLFEKASILHQESLINVSWTSRGSYLLFSLEIFPSLPFYSHTPSKRA